MLALLLPVIALAAPPQLEPTGEASQHLRVKRQLSPWMDSLADADRQAASAVLAQTLVDLQALPDAPDARLDEVVVLAEVRNEDLSLLGDGRSFARAFPELEVRADRQQRLEPAQSCAAARVQAERAADNARRISGVLHDMDVAPSRTSKQAMRRTVQLAEAFSAQLDSADPEAIDTGAQAAGWALIAGTSLMMDALDEDKAQLRSPAQLAPDLTDALTAAARDAWSCLEEDGDGEPAVLSDEVRR